MTIKQFRAQLVNKEMGRLYLFAGEEKFLINQYLKFVKE